MEEREQSTKGKGIADYPLAVLGSAFALGVLAGFALPMTVVERHRLGPSRDRLLDRARGTANDAVESGKAALREVVRGA
jgi:hypothetical protein